LAAVGTASDGGNIAAAVWLFDGTSWARITSPSFAGGADAEMITVERGSTGLVAVGYITTSAGDQDAAVWTSSNGRSWQRVSNADVFGGPGDQEAVGVVSTSSGLVAGGFDLGTTDAVIWISGDGQT